MSFSVFILHPARRFYTRHGNLAEAEADAFELVSNKVFPHAEVRDFSVGDEGMAVYSVYLVHRGATTSVQEQWSGPGNHRVTVHELPAPKEADDGLDGLDADIARGCREVSLEGTQ